MPLKSVGRALVGGVLMILAVLVSLAVTALTAAFRAVDADFFDLSED